MKRYMLTLFLVLGLAGLVAADTADNQGASFSAGLVAGYHSGLSAQVYGQASGFAENLPLSARFSIGYSSTGPGSALDARRIFINDATNGFPEKSGRIWAFRFDMLYPAEFLSLERAYIFGGPRYAMFTGNFKFVGGNEDFDVTSDQWGLGSGVQSFFRMSPRIDLVMTVGVDYYFEGTLTGHDTSYSPDGEDVNGRDDYTFDDADEAIDQPELEFQVLLGINYNL
ncbi:hypothetical protein GF420_04035 [candidate division GN15 bacterium]|nr:hypothetical protein [candidate division GN15 bacterium]